MGIYTDDDVYYGFQVPLTSVLPAGATADDYEGRALGEAIAFRLCEMADADPALAAAFASEHRPRKILVEYDGGVRFVYEQSPIERRAEDGRAVAIRPVPATPSARTLWPSPRRFSPRIASVERSVCGPSAPCGRRTTPSASLIARCKACGSSDLEER